MAAILLLIAATLVPSQAQYSNVRYQPERNSANNGQARQEQDLSNYYTVPADAPQTFGIPADSYEAPSYIYTANPDEEQKNLVSTKNLATELPEVNDKASEIEVEKIEGAYYVLLPSSQLQRVQFVTENDRQNMAYTARLQYRNEAAPIFVYTQQQQAAYMQYEQQ